MKARATGKCCPCLYLDPCVSLLYVLPHPAQVGAWEGLGGHLPASKGQKPNVLFFYGPEKPQSFFLCIPTYGILSLFNIAGDVYFYTSTNLLEKNTSVFSSWESQLNMNTTYSRLNLTKTYWIITTKVKVSYIHLRWWFVLFYWKISATFISIIGKIFREKNLSAFPSR